MRPASRWLPTLILIGAQLAVGSAALMARAGLSAGVGALALSAWRMLAASLLLTIGLHLAARLRAAPPASPLDRRAQIRLILAGLCLGLHFAAWFASLQVISVARSTLLVATTPVFAGLGGMLWLRQRLPTLFWGGLAVAAVGVYLVTGSAPGSALPSGRGAWLGDLLAVLGAVFIAAYMLLTQDLQTRLGTWRTVAWTYSSAALLMGFLAPAVGPPTALLPRAAAGWLAILGLALIPQLLGHTAINWSLKHFTTGAVAASTLLEPVFAAALAWWLLGETISPRQALGAALLLAGVGLTLRHSDLPVEETL